MRVKIVKKDPPKGLICYKFNKNKAYLYMSEQTYIPCMTQTRDLSVLTNFWATAYFFLGELKDRNIEKVFIYCNHKICKCCNVMEEHINKKFSEETRKMIKVMTDETKRVQTKALAKIPKKPERPRINDKPKSVVKKKRKEY